MKRQIYIGEKILEYTLTRKKRRTVGISISLEKGVQVCVPKTIRDEQITEIIRKKASWIEKKLEYINELKRNIVPRNFINGENFSYMGIECNLNVMRTFGRTRTKVLFHDNKNIVVDIPDSVQENEVKQIIKNSMLNWYKERAAEVTKERIALYSRKMNVAPQKIFIKAQKTRWGSCTKDNNININWKIIMAPLEIIDYLVVHELAHIIERNHSKNFWNVVQNILPDYKERAKWLKLNGSKLEI